MNILSRWRVAGIDFCASPVPSTLYGEISDPEGEPVPRRIDGSQPLPEDFRAPRVDAALSVGRLAGRP